MDQNEVLELEQFMDVVLLYKCKFCDFQCSTHHAMSSHVIQDHVAVKESMPQETDSAQPVEDVQSTVQQSVEVPEAEVDAGEADDIPHPMEEGEVCAESLVTNDDAETVVEADHDALGDQTETVQEHRKLQTEATEEFAQQTDQVLQTDESLPEMTEDQGSGETYQELYVCGQCSVGFTSMEECQAHLTSEHNMSESPEAEGQVSIGTQASLPKRTGRKTKAQKKAEQEEMQPEKPQNLAHTDLSLITRRMRGQEGKRMVRPPKKLMEDYRIESRKKKPPARPSARLMCPRKQCKAKFRSKEGLEVHKKCHKDEGAYQCPECEETQANWKPMQWHLWLEHRVDVDLCKCHLCDFRAENWQKVDRHLEYHDDEDEEGEEDDVTPSEEPSPVKKPRKPAGEKGKRGRPSLDKLPPECQICGRVFSHATVLKGHMQLVHMKERPLSCTFCEYTTGRKATLDLHLRTHTGEKPFKCDMCNYRASDHNSLRRHRMRHTGDRSYQCPQCPYTCIQSISMKMHMKNKHPGSEAMYACDLCPYHAVNKKNIEKHMEDHRRGLIEELKAVPQKEKKQLMLPLNQMSSNVISLAAKEAELIQEDTVEQAMQISAPGSYAIEANEECMNMISSGELVFTIESASDGKQYLVPSTLSAVGLTDQSSQVITEPNQDIVSMVQVLVEGPPVTTTDGLQLVTDVGETSSQTMQTL